MARIALNELLYIVDDRPWIGVGFFSRSEAEPVKVFSSEARIFL